MAKIGLRQSHLVASCITLWEASLLRSVQRLELLGAEAEIIYLWPNKLSPYPFAMIKKIVIITLIVSAILSIAYFVSTHSGNSAINNPEASKKGLIQNYTHKKIQIEELKNFYNSIVPHSLKVYIEFHDDNEVDLQVHADSGNVTRPRQPAIFQEWEINPYQYKHDSLAVDKSELTFEKTCKLLGWDHLTFKKIKQMLDNANCVSIENGEPMNIGFQRIGFGKYFYNLFDKAISDKAKYNDSCQYIFYTDKVVLEYGGGAVGPQCFPDADEK